MDVGSMRACPADLCHTRRNLHFLFLVSLVIAIEGKACNLKSESIIRQLHNSSCAGGFSPVLIKPPFLRGMASGGHV